MVLHIAVGIQEMFLCFLYSCGMVEIKTQNQYPRILDDTEQGMTERIMGDKDDISELS